jgi:hypothetical protein
MHKHFVLMLVYSMFLLALERNFCLIFISINFPVIFFQTPNCWRNWGKKRISDHSWDKAAAVLQCSAKKLSEIFFLSAYVFYFCKVPFVSEYFAWSILYSEVFDLFLTDNRFSLSTFYYRVTYCTYLFIKQYLYRIYWIWESLVILIIWGEVWSEKEINLIFTSL